jgi:hypothetical protein
MGTERKKTIYIQFWNADTAEWEWREFATGDIPELMELGIIDTGALGYAMDDQAAFDKVMDAMIEAREPWTYERMVNTYLDHTDHEIRIKA